MQVVGTVEQILYAVDDEEAKRIIAEAQREPGHYLLDAAPQ